MKGLCCWCNVEKHPMGSLPRTLMHMQRSIDHHWARLVAWFAQHFHRARESNIDKSSVPNRKQRQWDRSELQCARQSRTSWFDEGAREHSAMQQSCHTEETKLEQESCGTSIGLGKVRSDGKLQASITVRAITRQTSSQSHGKLALGNCR